MLRQFLSALALVALAMTSYAAAEYTWWFDDAESVAGSGPLAGNGSFSLSIDAAPLDGSRPHTLYFQIKDNDGSLSSPCSALFYKTFGLEGSTAYVYVDGQFYDAVPTPAAAGCAAFEIDASRYPLGLHTITVQVISSDNVPVMPVEGVFMRVPMADEIAGYRCFYTIDNDMSVLRSGSYSGGIVHADIDVESLSTGIHSIQFMLASDDGLTTQCSSSYFMKLPLGGGDISSYDYWVNDDTGNITHVDLKEAVSPFRLTALLPLKSYPLRTSSYRFRIENGEPFIYPLNDFNMLVSSASGVFTSLSSPYYDANVPTPVSTEGIEPTPDGALTTVPPVGAGEMKWYEFDVAKGDSIAIKTDAPCTVDLFDGDGNMMYTASGHDVMQGGGFHSFSDGTIYLSLHDVQKSDPVGLTVQHIDRYALLRHTPSEIASDGLVFIDLNGNGFEHLGRVTIGDKYEMECDSIYACDNTFARVCFNFYNEQASIEGPQTLNLYFDDGTDEGKATLRVAEAIAVDKRDAQPLEVTVNTYSNQFLLDHPVSVTIVNPGNVAYWGVPVNIAMDVTDKSIAFKNFIAETLISDDQEFLQLSYKTENLLGMNTSGTYMPLMLSYIGPGEKLVLDFIVEGCRPNEKFRFYAWCGEPWSEEARQLFDDSGALRSPARATPHQAVNYYRLQDGQIVIGMLGGKAGNAANVAIDIGINISSYYGALGRRQQEEQKLAMDADYINGFMADGALPNYNLMPRPKSVGAVALDAVPLPKRVQIPLGLFQLIRNRQQEHAEIAEPMPCAHNVSIPVAWDPNDIIGYSSPAGTEHIGVDVQTLDYIVEFENDPEMATASAQTIVVTDTLDKQVFDFATLKVGEFKLGTHNVDFAGAVSGIKTVDMRPEINAIAQAEVRFDAESGELRLEVRSLDPITLEPTNNVMQGVLPVNTGGEGLGELHYSIRLRDGLADSTDVDNMAVIVFDENEPIETPVWHNVTDYTLPVSEISEVVTADNQTFTLSVNGSDDGAGIWCYDLFVRSADMPEWTLVASGLNETDGKIAFTAEAPIQQAQFVTVAWDKAGNMEDAYAMRKLAGDVDGSGAVDANDVLLLRAYYIGRKVTIDLSVADVNLDGSVDSQDATAARRIYLDSNLSGKKISHIRTRMKTIK